MYRPDYLKAVDLQLSLDLIREFPLGLLVSQSSSSELPEANYYPFLLRAEGEDMYLIGHIAKANPQWKSLGKKRVGVYFLGPNAYVSPTVYVKPLNVPTWNFAAVYIEGTVELLEGADQIEEILQTSVKHFEAQNKTSWKYDLPESFRSRLISAIVGIKIKVESIEGKFKMSQNRDPEDYQGVIKYFESGDSTCAQTLANWMKRSQHVL